MIVVKNGWKSLPFIGSKAPRWSICFVGPGRVHRDNAVPRRNSLSDLLINLGSGTCACQCHAITASIEYIHLKISPNSWKKNREQPITFAGGRWLQHSFHFSSCCLRWSDPLTLNPAGRASTSSQSQSTQTCHFLGDQSSCLVNGVGVEVVITITSDSTSVVTVAYEAAAAEWR